MNQAHFSKYDDQVFGAKIVPVFSRVIATVRLLGRWKDHPDIERDYLRKSAKLVVLIQNLVNQQNLCQSSLDKFDEDRQWETSGQVLKVMCAALECTEQSLKFLESFQVVATSTLNATATEWKAPERSAQTTVSDFSTNASESTGAGGGGITMQAAGVEVLEQLEELVVESASGEGWWFHRVATVLCDDGDGGGYGRRTSGKGCPWC